MKAEEKQALIRFAKKISNTDRYTHANGEVSFFSESISMSSENAVALAECALAALTAPTIKLPDYTPEVYPNHALENQKIKSRNDAISDCDDAIRAAGYQEEGE